MRAIVQRVQSAQVVVEGQTVGQIRQGLLVFLGIESADEASDQEWLLRKVTQLKVFEGGDGRMSESLLSSGGELLVVSQFTLHASTKKGTRPSFHRSAPPVKARQVYEAFLEAARMLLPDKVQSGVFGTHMDVSLMNCLLYTSDAADD